MVSKGVPTWVWEVGLWHVSSLQCSLHPAEGPPSDSPAAQSQTEILPNYIKAKRPKEGKKCVICGDIIKDSRARVHEMNAGLDKHSHPLTVCIGYSCHYQSNLQMPLPGSFTVCYTYTNMYMHVLTSAPTCTYMHEAIKSKGWELSPVHTFPAQDSWTAL